MSIETLGTASGAMLRPCSTSTAAFIETNIESVMLPFLDALGPAPTP